jgi:hypothetical protein
MGIHWEYPFPCASPAGHQAMQGLSFYATVSIEIQKLHSTYFSPVCAPIGQALPESVTHCSLPLIGGCSARMFWILAMYDHYTE